MADLAGEYSQSESDLDAPNLFQPSETRNSPWFCDINKGSNASQLELNLLERLLGPEKPSEAKPEPVVEHDFGQDQRDQRDQQDQLNEQQWHEHQELHQMQQQQQQQHFLMQQQQHMELHQLQHLEQLEFQQPQMEWQWANATDTDWTGCNGWSAAWELQAASYDWGIQTEVPGDSACSGVPGESACSGAVAASTWGAYMTTMSPPLWDCRGADMSTATVSLEAALPVAALHHGRVVPHMGIPQVAQGVVAPICLSTVLDATSSGYSTDATRKVLSTQQGPLHQPPPPPPAPRPPGFFSNDDRPVPGRVTSQIPPPPKVPPRGTFAPNAVSAASGGGEAVGSNSSFNVAWLPLGANNELQLCVDADSSNLDPQLMQISAHLLPTFTGCDCAQLEEEDLDTCALTNLVGTAWEDSFFRRSRVSSGQYKGTVALGIGSNGKMRRRACRVAICAAVACLHPEDFQAADAAGEHSQAFMELVAEARHALSSCGPMGALAEAPAAARRGDMDWPRRAEVAPASIASSSREDGHPWADPGNPQDCIKDPSTEPGVWNTSPKNPWQAMISPRSGSSSAATNMASSGGMASRSTTTPSGVTAQPTKPRTAGPWGRPTDEEIFEWIYPFMDAAIDWDTIEGCETEVHEA